LYEARYNPDNSPKNGTYRLGAWYNSERFGDQEIDTSGVSLASPLSNGMPRLHRGDASFYAVVDQPLFGGGPDGFAMFGRAMGAPDDRNLIVTYLDGGITYKSPFKNLFDQTGDTLGFAAAYAPALRHVVSGQRRAIVEFDTVADLEGVGLAVVGRCGISVHRSQTKSVAEPGLFGSTRIKTL
jgi:carbohydrate-selective porin OprB